MTTIEKNLTRLGFEYSQGYADDVCICRIYKKGNLKVDVTLTNEGKTTIEIEIDKSGTWHEVDFKEIKILDKIFNK
jgi:hypothetical protein